MRSTPAFRNRLKTHFKLSVAPGSGVKSFWTESLDEAAQFFQFPLKEQLSEKAKLLWLVKLRWVAIALFFVLSVPALATGLLSRGTASVYLGSLSLLLLFNLLSQLVVTDRKAPLGPVVTCFQLAFDLLILTALLATTGGFENPFVALFLLNVSLGGLLIPGRLSWPFLLLAHTLLGFLQFQLVVRNSGVIEPGTAAIFLVFHLLLFGFWFVMRSLGSYLDRQSERQAQIRLARAKQDRLRSVGALAAGFSHEFASPLNIAKICLDRVLRTAPSEDLRDAIRAIEDCGRILHQMNASQMDTRDFLFKNVEVSELLQDVVESWQEENPRARLRFVVREKVRSLLPPLNFSQVILNLLDNAHEASPEGEISVVLSVHLTEISISICDQGPGFSDSVLRQRGEPFITTKKEGTGLGLYVSELFAQSLGGELRLGNRSGEGAEVILAWPRAEEPA